MNMVPRAVMRNIHPLISYLYSKFISHLCIRNQDKGTEIRKDMITRLTNSLDNNRQRLKTEAPNTLRIPISLIRFSAVKEAMPNNPRQLIKMAKHAKAEASLPIRSSLVNFLAYSSSANW